MFNQKFVVMAISISLSDFSFRFVSYGRYEVVYCSPVTGKQWKCTTTDMQLIDATKNEEYPKIKDLNILKRVCKA